ncbi:MAG: tetratricopeptide repeat protein [Candidatus Rokubacteria bacterium]|nr:tetratricopeptide repeat protein [Candidatus Rokubacteria bacterium]
MRRVARALVPVVIALVTFGVFSTALDNGFVDWDDSVLITKNEHFRGLGWSQIRWMFSTILMGHYVPVTWLTLGLDYVLWGMDPAGYHFTNVVIHALNGALFYFLALRLLRASTSFGAFSLHVAAAVSALWFAIHPLRAESVAWVTERRDVLSGLFFFATLLLYLQARERDGAARVWRHAAAGACYVLAFLSKSMVMTLPALLILLDVYPFRRLTLSPRTWLAPDVWREKVPYLALGVVAALVGYWAQAANVFITTLTTIPLGGRVAMVAHSLWFYLSKTLLPTGLSPLYELPPRVELSAPEFRLPLVAAVVITAILVALWRRWPAGLAVWAAYALLLSPVIGIVHSGHQLTHDRYSYLSCLGWALLIGGAAGSLAVAYSRRVISSAVASAAAVAGVAWIAALGVLTWHQAGTWRDTETLWRYALESTPDCSVCQVNLGTVLLNQNLGALALGHLERALEHRPDRMRAHQNIGLALARGGDVERALGHFRRAVERYPDDPSTLMNFGVSLMKLRRPAEGIAYLRQAARLAPNDPTVAGNLASALLETGRAAEAVEMFRRAVALNPSGSYPRYGLMQALLSTGDMDGARRELSFLRVVDPPAANAVGPLTLERW